MIVNNLYGLSMTSLSSKSFTNSLAYTSETHIMPKFKKRNYKNTKSYIMLYNSYLENINI